MVKPMATTEMAEILETLHWPQRTLAVVLGIDESNVRRWQRGDRPVPEPIAVWLRQLAAAHRRLPPPAAPDRPIRPGRPPGGSLYAAAKPAGRGA
jgi:hypothetical protein